MTNFPLKGVRAGERWNGCSGSLSSNGTTFDETLDSLEMEFINQAGTVVLTLTSDDDQIAITDPGPGTWRFRVEPVNNFISIPGTYNWAIRTVNSAGHPKTYHEGTIPVRP